MFSNYFNLYNCCQDVYEKHNITKSCVPIYNQNKMLIIITIFIFKIGNCLVKNQTV